MSRRTRIDHRMLAGGVTMMTARGAQPGPVLALLGGVHGDEDEGVLAVHRVIRGLHDMPLAGTVHAVARANPDAWAAQRRENPLDGANLARSFPGDADGGPTATAAASITEHVISVADALVDLHSAGLRYRMPLMCGFHDGPAGDAKGSRQLAEAFGAPLIWAHPDLAPGRSLSVAAEFGIPAIYTECSGGGSIRAHELDTYITGVLGVMAHLGMLPDGYLVASSPRWVTGAGDLDHGAQAHRHGFFVTSVSAGDTVDSGGELGRFYDFTGELLHLVEAPATGVVTFLRRQARTSPRDVLYLLAEEREL